MGKVTIQDILKDNDPTKALDDFEKLINSNNLAVYFSDNPLELAALKTLIEKSPNQSDDMSQISRFSTIYTALT